MTTVLCTVDGCGKAAPSRGLCEMHRARLRRRGSVHGVTRIFGDDLRRFLTKVVKPADPDACWLWTGTLNDEGYGTFHTTERSTQFRSHRWLYEKIVGPIPPLPNGEQMPLDHVCHTRDKSCVGGPSCIHRRCVNPAHLEPVTHRENQLRGRPSGPGYVHRNGGLIEEGESHRGS